MGVQFGDIVDARKIAIRDLEGEIVAFDGLLVDNLNLMRAHGLSAAIYTQMTDMKIEQNGYLSLDREVSKAEPEAFRRAHDRLYGPVPKLSPSTWWKSESASIDRDRVSSARGSLSPA